MTNWTDVDSVKEYLGEDAPADGDAEAQQNLEDAIAAASELLYSLSGRKFPGVLSAIVRPVPYLAQVGTGRRVPIPQSTWGLCWGYPHTRCEAPIFIGLGRSPLISIEEIVINDEAVDPIKYRIDDQKWLVRTDCCSWPMCGCTCDNFTVDFTWGEDPPQLGVQAAIMLAAEMYRGMTPGMNCKLPARLTSITRQGLSFAVIDPMDFMEKGLTGIYQIDMFLQAYNPGRQIRKPTVFSPDLINTGRRQTWP